MEGFAKFEDIQSETEGNIESLSDWRTLKLEAASQAQQLIDEISDFESLTTSLKIDSLKSLLVSLDSNNANRFVAEEVAKKISLVIEEDRHLNRLNQLEVAV